MYYVTGHERGGVLVTLYAPQHQVTFHLETEQVSGELLLEPRRVWGVKLDAEAEGRLQHRQADLTAHRLLHIQPVLGILQHLLCKINHLL